MGPIVPLATIEKLFNLMRSEVLELTGGCLKYL